MSAIYAEGSKLNSCNDGLYLPYSIAGVKGVNTSIIHLKKYFFIPESARAKLQTVTSNIPLADGGKFKL